MAKRKHTPEQVLNKLRQAETAISRGSTVAEASRMIGVSKQPSTDGGLGTVGGGSTRRDGSSSWRPNTRSLAARVGAPVAAQLRSTATGEEQSLSALPVAATA